jgi:hypothetical protein
MTASLHYTVPMIEFLDCLLYGLLTSEEFLVQLRTFFREPHEFHYHTSSQVHSSKVEGLDGMPPKVALLFWTPAIEVIHLKQPVVVEHIVLETHGLSDLPKVQHPLPLGLEVESHGQILEALIHLCVGLCTLNLFEYLEYLLLAIKVIP